MSDIETAFPTGGTAASPRPADDHEPVVPVGSRLALEEEDEWVAHRMAMIAGGRAAVETAGAAMRIHGPGGEFPPAGQVGSPPPSIPADGPVAVRLPEVFDDVDDLVARFLESGTHLHFASAMARPGALAYAVARVWGARGGRFTVSCTALHGAMHALTIAGVIERAITGFAGDNWPTSRPNPLYSAVPAGRPFPVEEWSLLSFIQRLIAAATAQPYATTTSLVGSDLLRALPTELARPISDGPVDTRTVLIAPLAPEVTLIHGVCADRRGNIVLVPPYGEGAWGALAARRGVIATVERIVPSLAAEDLTGCAVIPGHRVLGLAEAPLGAHPQGLRTQGVGGVKGYRDDYRFLAEQAEACTDPERARFWFDSWVGLRGGHRAYLDALGQDRRQQLTTGDARTRAQTRAAQAASPRTAPATPGRRTPATRTTTQPTAKQRLIVLAARTVVDRVTERGYDTVLAGIGLSHLATWLAAEMVRQRGGRPFTVLAELGFIGMRPQSGDAFLFSQDHADTCERLGGIADVLGELVAAGRSHCLGVLSAAQIDQSGNIDTSRTRDGRYLVGSGGANDVASTTDVVAVVPAHPERYVPKVTFVTSPGRRVIDVVSQFGRFGRPTSDDLFDLVTWLPPEAPDVRAPASCIERFTGWQAAGDGAADEPPVSDDELTLLSRLDPHGIYR